MAEITRLEALMRADDRAGQSGNNQITTKTCILRPSPSPKEKGAG
ncbi:hypothetical protein [Rhizobium sp. CF080]|nr:hypothetical protein [Rhizobium sp. CF080]